MPAVPRGASSFLNTNGTLIKGVNIGSGHSDASNVAPQTIIASMWSDGWDWTSVKEQVDLTHAMGANAWRFIGSVHAVTSGMITRANYLARQVQLAAYIAGLGCYYFPTGFDQAGFDPTPTPTQIHDELVALGNALYPYRANLLGFDICNEGPGWTISNNAQLADIKATLPGVPFTSSCSEANMITDATFRATLAPYVDFYSQHLYNGSTQPVTLFDSVLADQAKPVLIGEFGKTVGSGDTAAVANYYSSIGALARRISGTGRGIAGYMQWQAKDLPAPSSVVVEANAFGMYRRDSTERTIFTTPFLGMPTV